MTTLDKQIDELKQITERFERHSSLRDIGLLIILLIVLFTAGCCTCRCSVSLDRHDKPVFTAELVPFRSTAR